MNKFLSILMFSTLLLMWVISKNALAQNKIYPKANIKQEQTTSADDEVIKNLDLLQNWDIVGPQGPDMDKIQTLNNLTPTGANHVK